MYLLCSKSKNLCAINFIHASSLLNAKRLTAAACRTSALAWILSALGRLDLGTKLKFQIRSLLRLGFQHSHSVIWVLLRRCPFFFIADIRSFRKWDIWIPEFRWDKLDTWLYLIVLQRKWYGLPNECSSSASIGWSLGSALITNDFT